MSSTELFPIKYISRNIKIDNLSNTNIIRFCHEHDYEFHYYRGYVTTINNKYIVLKGIDLRRINIPTVINVPIADMVEKEKSLITETMFCDLIHGYNKDGEKSFYYLVFYNGKFIPDNTSESVCDAIKQQFNKLNLNNDLIPEELPVSSMIFQDKVHKWMKCVFTDNVIYSDMERMYRLFEEVTELAQAMELDKNMLIKILGHVYNKEPGDVTKEIGDVAITFAALSNTRFVDFVKQGNLVLGDNYNLIDKIKASHARKHELGLAVV